jgi:hypothetical protein
VKLHKLIPARHRKSVLLPHIALRSGDNAAGTVGWQKRRPGARAFPLRGGPCQPSSILGETENVRAAEASRIHGRSIGASITSGCPLRGPRVSFRAVLLTWETSAPFTSLSGLRHRPEIPARGRAASPSTVAPSRFRNSGICRQSNLRSRAHASQHHDHQHLSQCQTSENSGRWAS